VPLITGLVCGQRQSDDESCPPMPQQPSRARPPSAARPRPHALGWLAALVLGSLPARAQPAPADDAFVLGKALMDQGRIAEACTKFAESLALDRRSGTLLNLAVCREQEGRHATALRLFEEARARAVKDGRADRVALTEEHLARIRPRLSWLTLRVAAGAVGPDLVVLRDGEELPRVRWGTIEALDPGPHTVVATAPGRARFEATVVLGPAGDAQVVEVPAPAPPLSAPAPPTRPLEVADAVPPPPRRSSSPVLAIGWTFTGVGAAALVAAGVFGVKAIHDVRVSDMQCPGNICTTTDAFQQAQDARTEARLADIVTPVGLFTTAAGLYLLLRNRPEPSGQRATTSLPRLSTAVAYGAWCISLRGPW
jgi:hypothetical protein